MIDPEEHTMARRMTAGADPIPHLPELILTVGTCWRAVRDAQTEVDPFGRAFDALDEVRASLETLAYHCTGQPNFLALAEGGRARPPGGDAAAPF